MGLFENLGRTVESFKQRAEDAAEETASGESAGETATGTDSDRECVDCGEPVGVDRSECPFCGGDVVATGSDDG